jgi:hypothetical protein
MDYQTIDRWHKTRTGYTIFGLVELVLAYILASLAINSGRLLEYALTFILAYGGARNLVKIFHAKKHEQRKH